MQKKFKIIVIVTDIQTGEEATEQDTIISSVESSELLIKPILRVISQLQENRELKQSR